MTTRTVGPTSTYSSIKTAMAASLASDVINLESGYSNENATVALNDMTLFGEANSNNIVVHLSQGVSTFTLTGVASINIDDSLDRNCSERGRCRDAALAHETGPHELAEPREQREDRHEADR